MKTPKSIILFATTLLFFYSCQKQLDLQYKSQLVLKDETEKLTSWLQKLASTRNGAQKDRILSIQKNLLIKELKIVPGSDNQTMIIVPLDSGFQSNRNKQLKKINTFILTINKEGMIVQGNIVQYFPTTKGIKKLQPVLFSNMVNEQPVETDGKFVYLGIFDEYLYEVQYKNGKQKSFAERRPYSSNINSSKIASRQKCIDWYLQTYENGVLVSEEYLYTTCGNSIDNEEVGPDGGGGGNDIEYEFQVKKTVKWIVAENPGWGGQIISEETIKGKRSSSEPEGGHFTEIKHYASICNFCSNATDVWAESSNSLSASNQSASARVSGLFQYNGSTTREEGSKSWSFSELFP
ncbi:hypothetical protein [Pedobacter sp. UBA5917]|jgi:hypothetical protein|uniref:hypothetical protein n=1 Tax=Pedobacter sp. UBA5917 TaxID=1947061 RepID=UPI0025CDA4FC|nr:hypothetical protein [Pedobacter sp. UBA5917]